MPSSATSITRAHKARFETSLLTENLPRSASDHFKIIDCGMKSFPIEALSHAPLTAMMKCVKENNLKADQVAEIKVEVIARAADILGDPPNIGRRARRPPIIRCRTSLAVGLVDGMVTPLQFKDGARSRPEVDPGHGQDQGCRERRI